MVLCVVPADLVNGSRRAAVTVVWAEDKGGTG
jgi:hypothetical protein